LLVAGGWFVLREKYCWLVADKPNEQGVSPRSMCIQTILSPRYALHLVLIFLKKRVNLSFMREESKFLQLYLLTLMLKQLQLLL
jgi:hypothetical protein